MNTFDIAGRTLEFIPDEHIYLVDGVVVPSITQILKIKFGRKYESIDPAVLTRAAEQGTAVHKAIENYCKGKDFESLQEVRNFAFLKKQYKFDVLDNEVPVILFDGSEPIAAGTCDLVLFWKDEMGIGDIKRTATLDREYLAYQLNLYRIAYQQSYGAKITFLKGLWLREEVRRFITLPIDQEMAWQLVDEWREQNE